MKILAIETSCDETAIAILWAEGTEKSASFTVLGNALISQVNVHKEYGGVFPALAKREHAKNLVPILEAALEEAELLHGDTQEISEEMHNELAEILAREPGLAEAFFEFADEHGRPEIDAIAVTRGPGLEPALWVGINFARALALLWDKPLVAVNHMEGHILSALAYGEDETLVIKNVEMPVLALLISGGHTELVLSRSWLNYELIGQTRDDAVGEAFDKVARMLGLPYPGGPEISRLATEARSKSQISNIKLPRPMINSNTCDFSFSGLKTAALYALRGKDLTEDEKNAFAAEFEDAVADIIVSKTRKALSDTGAQTFVIGGGVAANRYLREKLEALVLEEFPDVDLRLPELSITGDNATMIAQAALARRLSGIKDNAGPDLRAVGNLSLAS